MKLILGLLMAAIVGIVVFLTLGMAIYGLYLAFSASVILGIIVLVLEPAPWVLGLIGFFSNPLVCEQIAKWAGLTV